MKNKIDFDLSLNGDALYYENIRKWFEHHESADSIRFDNEQRPISATYNAPSAWDFQQMKKIDSVLREAGNNPTAENLKAITDILTEVEQ